MGVNGVTTVSLIFFIRILRDKKSTDLKRLKKFKKKAKELKIKTTEFDDIDRYFKDDNINLKKSEWETIGKLFLDTYPHLLNLKYVPYKKIHLIYSFLDARVELDDIFQESLEYDPRVFYECSKFKPIDVDDIPDLQPYVDSGFCKCREDVILTFPEVYKKHLYPPWEEIPEIFTKYRFTYRNWTYSGWRRNPYGNKWSEIAFDLVFNEDKNKKKMYGFSKDGVDWDKGWVHIRAIRRDYGANVIPCERKLDTIAYLLSEWCYDFKWET